jgi:hypothetical protein
MADRTQRILAEPYTRFYITKKGSGREQTALDNSEVVVEIFKVQR